MGDSITLWFIWSILENGGIDLIVLHRLQSLNRVLLPKNQRADIDQTMRIMNLSGVVGLGKELPREIAWKRVPLKLTWSLGVLSFMEQLEN
jgi:hypothetical protein